MKEYAKYITEWIREETSKANAKGVVVGISGGIDSALVASLAKNAFPNNSLGVIMPIGNMSIDYEDAKKVINSSGLKEAEVELSAAYDALEKATGVSDKLAKANIKPRLRMAVLYALAQEKNYLVLGTDNAAEWILGYFTKYGDGGVDLLPIVHLKKREVREMAQLFKVPDSVLNKKPTAALWEGQSDEEELGFSYDKVDDFIDGKKIEPSIKAKIEKQVKSTMHKRKPLPIPKNKKEF